MIDDFTEVKNIEKVLIKKPIAVTIFGICNIIFGCYFLVRIIYGWYKLIAKDFKNPEEIIGSGILHLLLFLVIVGLAVWLIVLGIGLLKMKRWARRGSVMFARIQIVFIVIILVCLIVSMIAEWKDTPRIFMSSITINNGLAVIHWIYMVLLLIFMQTSKVKQAFGEG